MRFSRVAEVAITKRRALSAGDSSSGFICENVKIPIPNQHLKINILDGCGQKINEHPRGCLFRLNKSGCSFIIQEKETVAWVNSLRFPTSGEKRLAIKTRRTETKRNCLVFPTSRMTSSSATVIVVHIRLPLEGVKCGAQHVAGLGVSWRQLGVRYAFLSFALFRFLPLPVSSPPQNERNEYFTGRSWCRERHNQRSRNRA